MHDSRSIDLLHLIGCGPIRNKVSKHISVINDNFSKCIWTVSLGTKIAPTTKVSFVNSPQTSKRKTSSNETDKENLFINKTFNDYFFKSEMIRRYTWFKLEGALFPGEINKTFRNLIDKPVFAKSNTNWKDEIKGKKRRTITKHPSTKLTPNQTSPKNEKKCLQKFIRPRMNKKQNSKMSFSWDSRKRSSFLRKWKAKGCQRLYTITEHPWYNTILYYEKLAWNATQKQN